jgi:PAS domain S-box-containing protein
LVRSPSVVTVPSTDRAFRVHVDAALARVPGLTAEALAHELRKAYPDASLHVSAAWASLGEGLRWYVYRDGTVARTATDAEWWRAPELPRTIADANGRYVDANDAACELFGVPRSMVVGARIGSFTRHEDDEALAQRLSEELARSGDLLSTAVVVTPRGVEIPIEFRTMRAENGDSFTTVMRPVSLPR